VSLNGDPVAPEALGAAVAERLSHDRQKVVFFKIDDDANYGRAVKVMDICRGAGAATLGIVTKDDK
jgi:biopolymer transport protein ExbD